MALRLSAQLEKLITKCDISKNTIIKETGTDRSTFYQILSDKRIPTEFVFSSLMHFFIDFRQAHPDQISQSDLDHLLRSYLNETMTTKEMNDWKASASFIKKANASIESDESPLIPDTDHPSDQKVSDFLNRQLKVQDGRLDFYLSTELINRFHMHAYLRQSIPFKAHVNQLCGIYENGHQKISERILNAMADCIGFLSLQPENYYNVYCFRDSTVGKQNLLYPYYMIGKTEVMFISADGNRVIHVDESDTIEELHQYVNDIISRSTPLFPHVENYLELAQNLMKSYRTGASSVIYSVAERPCFWEIVTPDIISKYAPDQNIERFGLEYASVLKSLPNFYGLNSFEGLTAFDQDRYVSEAGLNLKLDQTDMDQLHVNFQNTLWKHIILLPFSNTFIHNWEIAIYYPDTVYLSMYDNSRSVLCLKDHNLIDPLFTYYDSMFHVLYRHEKK